MSGIWGEGQAPLPEEMFLQSIYQLVRSDDSEVSVEKDESLYLRPLEIATDQRLLAQPSLTYLYVLMASPVADYFPRGIRPVRVWMSTDYSRATPGGTGEAKCAGNYAAAMLAQKEGAAHSCEQVVWLDSVEHRYVEEMGGMNCFFIFSNDHLVTPALTGTILAGVTRDSILQLGSDMGLVVEERRISKDEWEECARDGSLREVFACGTAAVVTPVGEVVHAAGSFAIGNGTSGELTLRIRETLLGMQKGLIEDVHGWMERIE